MDAVRTIEVQQKALELKISRFYNAIKDLCQISHVELANKIYEEAQQLSLPSRSWVNAWEAKNNFRIANAKEIAIERIKAANPDVIKNWLLFYKELFNRDARLLYNADETFLNFKRDYKSIACGLANPVTPEDKGSHMTAMVYFSASGDVIKPMIILPGIKKVPQNLNEYEEKALFTASRKGWMTSQLWEVFIMNFVSEIKMKRLTWPKEI